MIKVGIPVWLVLVEVLFTLGTVGVAVGIKGVLVLLTLGVGVAVATVTLAAGVAVALLTVAVGVAVAAVTPVGLDKASAVCVPARIELKGLVGRGVAKARVLITVGVEIGETEADFSQADTSKVSMMPTVKIVQKCFFIRLSSFSYSRMYLKKTQSGCPLMINFVRKDSSITLWLGQGHPAQ